MSQVINFTVIALFFGDDFKEKKQTKYKFLQLNKSLYKYNNIIAILRTFQARNKKENK